MSGSLKYLQLYFGPEIWNADSRTTFFPHKSLGGTIPHEHHVPTHKHKYSTQIKHESSFNLTLRLWYRSSELFYKPQRKLLNSIPRNYPKQRTFISLDNRRLTAEWKNRCWKEASSTLTEQVRHMGKSFQLVVQHSCKTSSVHGSQPSIEDYITSQQHVPLLKHHFMSILWHVRAFYRIQSQIQSLNTYFQYLQVAYLKTNKAFIQILWLNVNSSRK